MCIFNKTKKTIQSIYHRKKKILTTEFDDQNEAYSNNQKE